MIYTKHILAPFNDIEKVQKCIICGEIIHNYQNAMYALDPDGKPIVEKGWMEGEHYVSTGNPTYLQTIAPIEDYETKIVNCK